MVQDKREFGEHGGVAPSISRSSTFTVMEPGTMPDIFQGERGPEKGGCFLYSRHFNPTVDVLSRYVAAMEGTESAICTASGMSAISCTILQLCHSNDHIIASDTIYGGSHALFADLLPQMNIHTTFVDITDPRSCQSRLYGKYQGCLYGSSGQSNPQSCRHSRPGGAGPPESRFPGGGQYVLADDYLSGHAGRRCGRALHDKIHQWRQRPYRRCYLR